MISPSFATYGYCHSFYVSKSFLSSIFDRVNTTPKGQQALASFSDIKVTSEELAITVQYCIVVFLRKKFRTIFVVTQSFCFFLSFYCLLLHQPLCLHPDLYWSQITVCFFAAIILMAQKIKYGLRYQSFMGGGAHSILIVIIKNALIWLVQSVTIPPPLI